MIGCRKKHTSGYDIHCHIADDTTVANKSLKQLLSNIETKQQLTVSLSEYVISKFEWLGIDYVISYDSVSNTNLGMFIGRNLHHSHEEADTVLIMHCWEIARANPLNQCLVYSPGIDVFLLLIFCYPSFPNALIFCTGKWSNLGDISIDSCYEALLGFHTFTGCD